MKFKSCSMISRFALNFNGRIDTGKNVVSLCCEPVPGRPAVPFAGTPREMLDRFIGMRTAVLAESIHDPAGTRFGCGKCANYLEDDWEVGLFITFVNLSMYPAPCQCRCSYCDVAKQWRDTPEVREAYEKLFELLNMAKSQGIIVPDAAWQVSTGEITIHPYKERIMELVKGQKTLFFTNAFLYDEDIAQNLHDNPASAINLSIDAGTPETWKKIKGFDNFELVASNLAQYYHNSARAGQITLKYIILPGVNDTYEDYMSLMEIMKVLEVKHLTIARDVRGKYGEDAEAHARLMGAAAYLLAICHKNGITNDMYTYTPAEREESASLAREVLQKNLI